MIDDRYRSPYTFEKKVLIVGSGMTAKQVSDYPYQQKDWCILTCNHGWKATPHWKYAVMSTGVERPEPGPGQTVLPTAEKILCYFGGHNECGFSMMMVASYWSLLNLEPKVIGYLGADMIYTPDANGDTHFYGIGADIKKGEPDPDKMVREHNIKKDPNFLHNIYMRFRNTAAKYDCKVYNFAKIEETRLPYPKEHPEGKLYGV